MVQHQEEADGTTTIARVGKRKKGYDVHQVDAFLEQAHALYEADGIQLHRSDIQDASFDIVRCQTPCRSLHPISVRKH